MSARRLTVAYARRLTLTTLASLCVLAGWLALSGPASAFTEHVLSGTFGEPCSGSPCGNGQLSEPTGVAVNDATHDVYVLDSGDKRIEEFTSTGVFVRQFTPPSGTGRLAWIAIDNSGDLLTDPSAEDVYASVYSFAEGGLVVDKFSAAGVYLGQLPRVAGTEAVAVAPDGEVLVGDGEGISSYSDATVNMLISTNLNENEDGGGLSVDSEGRIYAAQGSGVNRYSGSGEPTQFGAGAGPEATGGISDLAVDTSTTDVYLTDGQVSVYGPDELLIERFGAKNLDGPDGLAVDPSTHRVYVADNSAGDVAIFDQVVLPDVSTGEEPTELEHEGSATLDGMVDPDGEPVTSCMFEYGTETSYGMTAPCETAHGSVGSGTSPVEVHAKVSGLTPLTRYHYRLVAADKNGVHPGADRTFVAPGPPAVGAEWASDVVAVGAELQAEVNPGGADATYRFEYGMTTSYGMSLPVPEGDAGAGALETLVSVHPQDLLPGTTYHFRVVVGNGVEREVPGRDEQFTTQPAGTAFSLVDGRQWELVSPPDKGDAGLISGAEYGAAIQAAAGGGAVTYIANGPLPSAAGNIALNRSQLFSRRGPGGWETRDITSPRGEVPPLELRQEYKLFSSDLSLGFLDPAGVTALGSLPEGSEKTPYLRDDLSEEYEPLLTTANTPAGSEYGRQHLGFGVEFEGASRDLRHVVVRSGVPLVEGAGPSSLYELSGGRPQLVDVLPMSEVGEGASPGFSGLGKAPKVGVALTEGAVSSDGSRVIWSQLFNGDHLYLRDTVAGETIKLDTVQSGAEGNEEGYAEYQGANSDGTRIFFTDGTRLTVGSTASEGAPDLYVFELTSAAGEPLAGTLTDLTVDANAGETASVQGDVLGYSEDGSYVYFVASGVLGDGGERGAVVEGDNLYVEHYGGAGWVAPRFIAALSGADFQDWTALVFGGMGRTARVSPNGRFVAFMSEGSLTGYDNHDVNSGVADEEVFLYDAQADRLVCASCNPTGERPSGMLDEGGYPGPLIDPSRSIWRGRWLAGSVPGWNEQDLGEPAPYQRRYLSNDGRLFFDSPDELVPADVSGRENVYEYEPEGTGSCRAASQGSSVVFSERATGCVGLLSSGTSPAESAFLDADEEGTEVFFLTSSRLVSQDVDSAVDLYDAHECTGASPCPAPAATVPAPCVTADACRAAPAPQPAVFGAPSSATFSGSGNVSSVSSPPATAKAKLVRCKRGYVRKRARCVRVKTKRKRKARGSAIKGRAKS